MKKIITALCLSALAWGASATEYFRLTPENAISGEGILFQTKYMAPDWQQTTAGKENCAITDSFKDNTKQALSANWKLAEETVRLQSSITRAGENKLNLQSPSIRLRKALTDRASSSARFFLFRNTSEPKFSRMKKIFRSPRNSLRSDARRPGHARNSRFTFRPESFPSKVMSITLFRTTGHTADRAGKSGFSSARKRRTEDSDTQIVR